MTAERSPLSRKVYFAHDARDAHRVATFLTTNGVKAWPVLEDVSPTIAEALPSFSCSVAVAANEVLRAHELISSLMVLPREGHVPDEEIERELRDQESDDPPTK